METDPGPILFPTERSRPFDPPPELGALRQEQPLVPLSYPDGTAGWLVTSHPLVRSVLADARFSSLPGFTFPRPFGGAANANRSADEVRREAFVGMMEASDPPQHTRLRQLHTAFFTVRRVNERRAALEQIVAERLDAIERSGSPVDLVTAFTVPVCSMMICEFLGTAVTDRANFEPLIELTTPLLIRGPDCDVQSADREKVAAADHTFVCYIEELIERKRAEPADDVLTALATNTDLTRDELIGAIRVLFQDGAQNTSILLGLSVLTLLSHPRQWDALRSDLSSLAQAVEELLRYTTMFQTISTRTAREDVELDGTAIRAGQRVSVALSAANRDPDQFPDPDSLDLARDAKGHVALGHGRHMCLGQHLVRTELEVALGALVRRFPRLRLTGSPLDTPVYSSGIACGVLSLPVEW